MPAIVSCIFLFTRTHTHNFSYQLCQATLGHESSVQADAADQKVPALDACPNLAESRLCCLVVAGDAGTSDVWLDLSLIRDIAGAIKDLLDAINEVSKAHPDLGSMREYKRVSNCTDYLILSFL